MNLNKLFFYLKRLYYIILRFRAANPSKKKSLRTHTPEPVSLIFEFLQFKYYKEEERNKNNSILFFFLFISLFIIYFF